MNTSYKLPGGGIKCLLYLSNKDIYNILLFNKKTDIASKQYWVKKFPGLEISWDMWYKNNFINKLLPRRCKDFNWRVFYGQVNTERRLLKMKMSDGICKICGSTFENLEHILIACQDLQVIWSTIEGIINKSFKCTLMLTRLNKMGVFMEESSTTDLVNVVLSICRWEIWKRRCTYKYDSVLYNVHECLKVILDKLLIHMNLLRRVLKDKEVVSLCELLGDVIENHRRI